MAGRDIPEDIVVEILRRLPVKSVLRFRCVCKSWHSTISDQQFVKLHQKRSSTLLIVSANKDGEKQFKTVNYQAILASAANNTDLSTIAMEYYDIPPSFPTYFRVLGPCNGLFCFIHGSSVYLWNPPTRDFKVLPAYTEFDTSYGMAEYLDLCFDRSTDDYKIVRTATVARTRTVVRHWKYIPVMTEIEVFSLNTNAWRRVPPDHVFNLSTRLGTGIFSNGAHHWLAIYLSRFRDEKFILAFDLAEEKLQVLPKPDLDINKSCLAVLGECICLCFNSNESMSLWIMKEYGMKESWTKLLTVPACQIAELSSFSFWPLCFLQDGDILGTCGGTELLRCNVEKQSVERIMSFAVVDDDGNRDWDSIFVYLHMESLYSITQHNNQALL